MIGNLEKNNWACTTHSPHLLLYFWDLPAKTPSSVPKCDDAIEASTGNLLISACYWMDGYNSGVQY